LLFPNIKFETVQTGEKSFWSW